MLRTDLLLVSVGILSWFKDCVYALPAEFTAACGLPALRAGRGALGRRRGASAHPAPQRDPGLGRVQ